MTKKIGFVGLGDMGKPIASNLKNHAINLMVYDIAGTKNRAPKNTIAANSLTDLVKYADIIFMSVPTPSNKDGSINLDVVDSVLKGVNSISNTDNIVIVRSTIVPGTTRKLQEKYSKLRLVFNPEFLTERSANFDFINQTRFILGGNGDDVKEVGDLFRERFGHSISIVETNYETAELIKYMTNTFFCT